MLYVKLLLSPHPRAKVKTLDVSKAEKMPGVAYVLTRPRMRRRPIRCPKNCSSRAKSWPSWPRKPRIRRRMRVDAIGVEYDILPFASNLQQAMAPNPPDLSTTNSDGNIVKTLFEWGEVDKAFAQADIVKEFTYFFNGRDPVPIAAAGLRCQMGRRQVDDVGHGPGDLSATSQLGQAAGHPARRRFATSTNGMAEHSAGRSAGAEVLSLDRLHLRKRPGGRSRLMLPKDQELAVLNIKPQNLSKFKVGATKDGKIIAMPARVPRQHRGANPGGRSSNERGRRRPVRAVPPRGSQLERGRLSLSDQFHAHGRVAQQFPAGVQVGLGTDDGRDGRSRGHGPGASSG